jgi:hypothetical protein
MKTPEHDPAARPDEDNPEWTRKDFVKARPALDMVAELFGAEAAEELRRRPSALPRGGI